MESTVQATKYAAKLRARLKELIALREKEKKAYKGKVDAWRKEIVAWIEANATRGRVLKIENQGNFRRERELNFDPHDFFRGAPPAPVLEEDKRIRRIRALLQQLGITGQATVRVSTKEVEQLFGDAPIGRHDFED